MGRNLINRRNFDIHNLKLKDFSNSTIISGKLGRVETDASVKDYFLDGVLTSIVNGHKVTGVEHNKLVSEVQRKFIEVNNVINDVIKEFAEIYQTFHFLDSEMLNGIILSIESAEKASSQAKEAQKDADDILKALQQTVSKLREFKDELNKLEHLHDIDAIWERLDTCVHSLKIQDKIFNEKIEDIQKGANDIFNVLQQSVSKLRGFKDGLNKIEHLYDIDAIWERLETCVHSLKIQNKIFNEKIEDIQKDSQSFEERITNNFNRIESVFHKINNLSDKINQLSEGSNHRLKDFFSNLTRENIKLKRRMRGVYIFSVIAVISSLSQIVFLYLGFFK